MVSPPLPAADGAADPVLPQIAGETHGLIEVIRRIESAGTPVTAPPVLAWLLGEGRRIQRDAEFFDALCWRLVGADLPLSRVNITVRTLHPQILGFAFRWYRRRRVTEVLRVGHGAEYTADYLESPIRPVTERGETVRFHLEDETTMLPYPLLETLRRDGATDYFACPLTFYNGRHQSMAWTTDRPGGFSADDIARMTEMRPAIGTVIEARAMRFITGTLLEIYLGRTAGRRVLDGEIRRAEGERMHAVILAADMRGFTHLSDRLPGEALIALLDDYFDAVAGPVQARGGEVLKFVGDGVLAIFPVGEEGEAAAAARALGAASESLARIARLSALRAASDRPQIRIGIGLHIGEIIYGNVGAADRLDFTAIGPAVNLAFRLESLTKRLDRPLLLSRDVALLLRQPVISLGFHPVKGLSEPEEVFGLAGNGALGR
ncbi:MAG: adenylate/guanylate cyclase domain-containing protein [Alphaproteobacteria bacterium]|nr:adenylate/guanylate cyclase domain-containing protein [Alphaproteobacteria bacterium]